MTPQEALQILDNVTAATPLVRADQEKVTLAIAVLKSLISKQETKNVQLQPEANKN